MKIKARRGVCIGVDRHLQAGDLADLDAAQVQFLVSIGAVEVVPDEDTKQAEEPQGDAPQTEAEPPAAPARTIRKK